MASDSRSSLAARVALAALVSASLLCLWKSRRLRKSRANRSKNWHKKQREKEMEYLEEGENSEDDFQINSQPCCNSTSRVPGTEAKGCCKSQRKSPELNSFISRGKLFFASQTGTSKSLAERLTKLLQENSIKVELVDPRSYEPEDIAKETLVIIIASTWEDGKAPDNAAFLAQWLEESSKDFRVGAGLLSNCKFAVFGVGSKGYGLTYNAAARAFFRQMTNLGGVQLLPIGEGDQDEGNLDETFKNWSRKLVECLTSKLEEKVTLSPKLSGSKNNLPSEEESDYYSGEDSEEDKENAPEAGLVDLEDVAGKALFTVKNGVSRKQFGKVNRATKDSNGDKPLSSVNRQSENGAKDMVTPTIRASLEKQVVFSLSSYNCKNQSNVREE